MVCGHDDLDLEDSTFGVRLHHRVVAVREPILVRGFGRGLQERGQDRRGWGYVVEGLGLDEPLVEAWGSVGYPSSPLPSPAATGRAPNR